VLCQWAPQWSHFIDAQTDVSFGVYQKLYMWVNPEAQRTLMLSMRYLASKDSGETPDNDTQHILLVEYMSTNVAYTIKELNLIAPPTSLLRANYSFKRTAVTGRGSIMRYAAAAA
jgi:hypothetical protein